jgi:transcriptional regulator with XRE-family HTH domain
MVTRSQIDPKALLAELLQAARQQSQYRSQEALARAIGKERTAVSKPEQGERVPAIDVLADILTACEVTGLARLAIEGVARVARAWDDPGTAQVAPWYETEARAHTLRYWAPTIVPGIAQTRSYATELFRVLGHDKAKIVELAEFRVSRQSIFTRDDPPDTTILLWEPVLHHQIGTAETMCEQLAHLLEPSSKAVIQVVPGSLGANAGLGGAINLAACDNAPELLVSEALVEDQITNSPVLVRRASAAFNRVRGDALNVHESRTRITEAMERWQS